MPFDQVIPLEDIPKETSALETHIYQENVYQAIIYLGTKLEITQVFNNRGRYP